MSGKQKPCACQVLERSRAEGTDLLVLAAIATFAYPDGTGAYPSEATIGRFAKKSPRTVRRSIGNLTALGELAVDYKAGPGGRTNAYTIMLSDPDTAMTGSDPDTAMSTSDWPDPDTALTTSTWPFSAPTRTSSVADPDTAMSAKPLEPSSEPPTEPSSVPTSSSSEREQLDEELWQCPTHDCPGTWPQDQPYCTHCGTEQPSTDHDHDHEIDVAGLFADLRRRRGWDR